MFRMGIHYDSGMSFIRAYVAYEKARRERECERLSKLVATVPVTDAVLQQLEQLNPDDFAQVMRSHPGEKLNRKIESVWTMLRVFRKACADLKADIRGYAAYDHRQRAELSGIDAAVQKDMFAACAAAESLLAHAQRVRLLVPEAEYKAQCASLFDVPQQSFIKQLRNNLVHVGFIEADWLVRYHFAVEDKPPTPNQSAFQFSRAQLVAEEFTGDARAYIAKAGEKIDVEGLFENYRERVDKFYAWLQHRIEASVPAELADYRRCADEHKRATARTVYRLFLSTWIDWKVDPYAHLQDYLTAEQIQEIERMPARSREQVNRIIEFADQDCVVNDELRGLVYRLFGVAE